MDIVPNDRVSTEEGQLHGRKPDQIRMGPNGGFRLCNWHPGGAMSKATLTRVNSAALPPKAPRFQQSGPFAGPPCVLLTAWDTDSK